MPTEWERRPHVAWVTTDDDDNIVISDRPQAVIGFIFEKNGQRVIVREDGVVSPSNSASHSEAQDVLAAQAAGWIGIHLPLKDRGFEFVGHEIQEDMAIELLSDGCESLAAAALARDEEKSAKSAGDIADAGGRAYRMVRQGIILTAAALEGLINEFVSLHIPNDLERIGSLPPAAKWSVAVRLATGKRIEDEAAEFPHLESIFRKRNKVVHFKPQTHIQLLGIDEKEGQGVRANLKSIRHPLRMMEIAANCTAVLNRLSKEGPMYDLEEVLSAALRNGGAPPGPAKRVLRSIKQGSAPPASG